MSAQETHTHISVQLERSLHTRHVTSHRLLKVQDKAINYSKIVLAHFCVCKFQTFSFSFAIAGCAHTGLSICRTIDWNSLPLCGAV